MFCPNRGFALLPVSLHPLVQEAFCYQGALVRDANRWMFIVARSMSTCEVQHTFLFLTEPATKTEHLHARVLHEMTPLLKHSARDELLELIYVDVGKHHMALPEVPAVRSQAAAASDDGRVNPLATSVLNSAIGVLQRAREPAH